MPSKLSTLIDWSLETHRDKLMNFLASLDTRAYWFDIKPYRASRSREANAYYWCCVKLITEFQGYDPEIKENRDKIHEELKKQFNSKEEVFKRKTFTCSLNEGILEYNEVDDYLEKIDWKPEVLNGNILLPLHIVRNIPERFEFGEEIIVDEIKTISVSTTSLDTVEFYQYVERIRDHYAHEHNFYIPEPQKVDGRLSEFDDIYEKIKG